MAGRARAVHALLLLAAGCASYRLDMKAKMTYMEKKADASQSRPSDDAVPTASSMVAVAPEVATVEAPMPTSATSGPIEASSGPIEEHGVGVPFKEHPFVLKQWERPALVEVSQATAGVAARTAATNTAVSSVFPMLDELKDHLQSSPFNVQFLGKMLLLVAVLGVWMARPKSGKKYLDLDLGGEAGSLRGAHGEPLTDPSEAQAPRHVAGHDDEPLALSTVAWIVLYIAVPSILGSLLVIFNEVTSTVFLGRVGSQAELAAVGLGNLMQNCVALSFGLGICSALDTLVSQAYGSGQHQLACHYLQRCRVLVTVQLVWMIPVLCMADRILVAVGQDPEVAEHAGHYCRTTSMGLFFLFQNTATASFLRNRGNLLAPMLLVVWSNIQQLGLCAFFVVRLGWGNYGAGCANSLANLLSFIFSSLYLCHVAQVNGLSKRSVLWVGPAGFRDLGSYMRLAVPATMSTCVEWWFWEIASLCAGFLGKAPLAAHVATANFNSVCFMGPAGLGSAAAVMVGHYVGARKPRKARTMVTIFGCTAVATWAMIALPVFLWRSQIAAAYSQDLEVRGIIEKLLCVFALAGFGDSTQVVLGGALRGVGMQNVTAVIFVVAYYCVTLPLAVFAAFKLGMGILGMWWGFVFGTGLAALTFTVLVLRVDFNAKVREAADRMEREQAALK